MKKKITIVTLSAVSLLVSVLDASCFSDYLENIKDCRAACTEHQDTTACQADCRRVAEKEYDRCSGAGA